MRLTPTASLFRDARPNGDAVPFFCILRQNERSKSMEGYRHKFLIVKEEGSGAPGGLELSTF